MTLRVKKYHFAYFSLKITNEQTEGFNRRIKDIARSGRGYSFQTLRAKVLFGRLPQKRQFNFDSFPKDSVKSQFLRKKYTREINAGTREYNLIDGYFYKNQHSVLKKRLIKEFLNFTSNSVCFFSLHIDSYIPFTASP